MKSGIIAVDLNGTLIDDSAAWVASACDIANKNESEFQHLRNLSNSRKVYEAIIGYSDVLEMEYFWYNLYRKFFDKIIIFENLVESLKILQDEFHICLFTNKRPTTRFTY